MQSLEEVNTHGQWRLISRVIVGLIQKLKNA